MQTLINVNQSSGKPQALSTWHPINNEWVHIFQIFKDDGTIEYFVNGVEQEIPTIHPKVIDKNAISTKITELEGSFQEFEVTGVAEDVLGLEADGL